MVAAAALVAANRRAISRRYPDWTLASEDACDSTMVSKRTERMRNETGRPWKHQKSDEDDECEWEQGGVGEEQRRESGERRSGERPE